MIKVKLFNRNKRKGNYSIESVFHLIKIGLSDKVLFEEYYLPNAGQRILSLIKIKAQASEVNHITGDISFLGIGLPSGNTIVTIHDLGHFDKTLKGLKKSIYKWIWFKWPLAKIKCITCISNFTRDQLIEKVGIPESKIEVIYNPASPEFKYCPKKINTDCPVILQIGAGANKNRDGLIFAVKGMTCKLIFIGKLNERHKALLKDFQIDYDNPIDIGTNELYLYYQQADIVYFASTYEGFGLPIIEAQAVGRPVITSNCASMPEVAGEGAIFVNPESVIEIRNAIKLLMENESVLRNIISHGLANIKRFELSIIAGQYFQLYASIINKSSNSS